MPRPNFIVSSESMTESQAIMIAEYGVDDFKSFCDDEENPFYMAA